MDVVGEKSEWAYITIVGQSLLEIRSVGAMPCTVRILPPIAVTFAQFISLIGSLGDMLVLHSELDQGKYICQGKTLCTDGTLV